MSRGLPVDARIDTNILEAQKMSSSIVSEMSKYTGSLDGKRKLRIFFAG
jgi:hypothetical protein